MIEIFSTELIQIRSESLDELKKWLSGIAENNEVLKDVKYHLEFKEGGDCYFNLHWFVEAENIKDDPKVAQLFLATLALEINSNRHLYVNSEYAFSAFAFKLNGHVIEGSMVFILLPNQPFISLENENLNYLKSLNEDINLKSRLFTSGFKVIDYPALKQNQVSVNEKYGLNIKIEFNASRYKNNAFSFVDFGYIGVLENEEKLKYYFNIVNEILKEQLTVSQPILVYLLRISNGVPQIEYLLLRKDEPISLLHQQEIVGYISSFTSMMDSLVSWKSLFKLLFRKCKSYFRYDPMFHNH